MESNRKPTRQEENLIELLIQKSTKEISKNWREGLLVRSMDDGKMGSLYLFPNGKIKDGRVMGEQISEVQFKDQDDIEVIASLNIDSEGDIFELDIWKIDFSELINLPDKM
jgi:hypothetical protein